MTDTEKKPPKLFDVPATTSQAQCSSCRAPVYWIVTASGAKMPVDCEPEGCRRPMLGASARDRIIHALQPDELPSVDGVGVSHFVTCPNRDQHRKRK